MSWFKNLKPGGGGRGQSGTDYYREGAELLAGEQYLEALTSFRLALRRKPDDIDVLQQMAVAYTRLGTEDDAIRTYRRVLDVDPHAAGAHYGLAFLLMNRGSDDEAVAHLRAFLARPPEQADAHIAHARAALAELTGEAIQYPDEYTG
ncbi:MAG: tetratricopeptide repeat protein [Gemmatimonadetes bacterium]|jgi:Flp pilus assembly protein TadD|nr:tetratricopeptide repeat protein [Gemmatimonadota bacterium]